MLRLVAAILLTLCGGGAGLLSSDKLRMERDISRQTSELIRQFSFSIRGRAADFYELIAVLREGRRFSALTFVESLPAEFSPDVDIRQAWRDAVSSQKNLHGDRLDVILSIADSIGTADSEGVLRSLDALLERSQLLEKSAQDRLEKCGKLYRSLGLLFGAMAAILVI